MGDWARGEMAAALAVSLLVLSRAAAAQTASAPLSRGASSAPTKPKAPLSAPKASKTLPSSTPAASTTSPSTPGRPAKAYHLTSKDGLTNWTNRGIAYNPDVPFVRYTDGTVNQWKMMERPAIIDVTKQEERPNDLPGSKIIVVPFDGERFNKDLSKLYE
jgi:hypothetical protein